MSRFFVYIVIVFCLLIIVGVLMMYGVVAGIQRLVKKPKPRYLPYAVVTVIGIVFTLSVVSYGYFIGRWELETNRVELIYPSLPDAFEGYTIVHLSDMHLSSFVGHEDKLMRIIDSVNISQPDLICFTGDLISLDTTEVAKLAPLLRRMQAKDGIVSVLGNHDFMPYRRDTSDLDSVAMVMTRLETELLGWRVLNNDHITIVRGIDTLTIAGCMNKSFESFHFFHREKHPPLQKGDLQKALAGTSGFRVLLTHDPSQWHYEIMETGRTDVALTLSGHTHCGQMRIGRWTPSYWYFDEVKGLYTSPYSSTPLQPIGCLYSPTLYVNTGLGCTAPIRLAVPMEVTVMVLGR